MQRAPKSIRWSVKAWGLGLALLSSSFFVLFQGGKLSLMLLVIITFLTVYLVLGRWSGIASAQGQREISGVTGGSILQSGSALKVHIRVEIPGYWPIPYIFVKDNLTRIGGESQQYEGTFVPDWRRRGELTYVTPPLERGLYRYERLECVTEDIFGFFEHRGKIHTPLTFSVLPRTVNIPQWIQLQTLFQSKQQQSSLHGSHRETTQMNGVREFIYGDRLAKVHWKSTARTGLWKSKQFEREALSKLHLILDSHSSAYRNKEQFELAVSISASLLRFAISRKMAIGLATANTDQAVHVAPGGVEAYRTIERHLIEVQPIQTKMSFHKLVDRRISKANGSLFVIITPQRNDELAKLLRWMNKKGAGVCLIDVSPAETNQTQEEWTTTLLSYGVVTYRMNKLEQLPVLLGGSGS
jgi:uncharacterized protein (DUF58 family)